MKQTKLLLILVCMISFSAFAQKQTTTRSSRSDVAAIVSQDTPEMTAKKSESARHCKDLNEQLTKLFGKDYSITNPAVKSQIEKNIDDKNASSCIRKTSLYVVYGDEYTKHADRIK